MKTLNNLIQRGFSRFERGSALLVSLMIMVGLSLLGLAFVAISETEGAISINQRNHTQTVAVAEAGAKLVVQWFQDPDLMLSRQLMPANNNVFKTNRTVEAYNGFYKPATATELLFDRPYKPAPPNRFYGDENSADIIINESTPQGLAFLRVLNQRALGVLPTAWNLAPAGVITDIRVYAPPIVGGALIRDAANNDFWVGGTRYGLATIRVRAEKKNPGDVAPDDADVMPPISQATVKIVIAEFPVPGPTGALQGGDAVGSQGNFEVHWGAVTSEGNVNLSKDYSTFPHANAYDITHIEHGYDSSDPWQPNRVYLPGEIVRPPQADILARPVLRNFEYEAVSGGTMKSEATAPLATDWPTTYGTPYNQKAGGVTFKTRYPTSYPNAESMTGIDGPDWLYEVSGAAMVDPWFSIRGKQSITTVLGAATFPANGPHPFKYSTPGQNFSTLQDHWFMGQSFNQRQEYKEVIFPNFDYDFWKAAAQAGNGQKGVRYLKYLAADSYTDGVSTKTIEGWLNNNPGFFFFDTMNGLNPQNKGPGTLAASQKINGTIVEGFTYMNFEAFGTTGTPTGTQYYPQPGEPYRDIGYRGVVEVSAGVNVQGQFLVDAGGRVITLDALNGKWDWQDLSWSNTGATSGGTKNKVFDIFLRQKQVNPDGMGGPSAGADYTAWFPVPWYPGCLPGNNAVLGTNALGCSEPHEPFMNLLYNDSAIAGARLLPVVAGWYDGSTTAGRPKRTDTGRRSGTPATCLAGWPAASETNFANCTSNGYDVDGGLVQIPVAIDGVMYVEGSFNSTGNADYFGSIVSKGVIDLGGTPRIYFDENLIKGGWPPRGIPLPRVMITSQEMDQ